LHIDQTTFETVVFKPEMCANFKEIRFKCMNYLLNYKWKNTLKE